MSKYKFDISKSVRDAVEWELRYYRENKRQLEEVKNDMIPSATQTPSFTKTTSNNASRQTEDVVLRMVSSPYLRRLEWACDAIERALKRLEDVDMKIIEMYYWRNEYTLEGAGYKIGLSKSATYHHANRIIGAIAFEMGYVKE